MFQLNKYSCYILQPTVVWSKLIIPHYMSEADSSCVMGRYMQTNTYPSWQTAVRLLLTITSKVARLSYVKVRRGPGITRAITSQIPHDDVIKWKVVTDEFPHKGQWRGALMFSLICAWINGWVNNGEAGDLRRHRAHYDVTVMHICHCVGSLHWRDMGCPLYV